MSGNRQRIALLLALVGIVSCSLDPSHLQVIFDCLQIGFINPCSSPLNFVSDFNFCPFQAAVDLAKKGPSLPPCKACNVLVESIYAGMKRTERGKHDGGDAAWEEERLGSYKTSEIRLVEIQERLCTELTRNTDQCLSLASELESEIEDWWFKRQQTEPDLRQFLCIDTMKVCCPDGYYGAECLKCTDCMGNGKCKGNGTRKGNGKCACDK